MSPDGAWIVSASHDRTLKIWDAATGTERATLTGHTDRVNGCAVSPDGAWIVSASCDRTLKIWDVATGTERATLTGHTDPVMRCAVSPDGAWIVSAGDDSTLRIWDAATGTERATLTGHTDAVTRLCGEPRRHLDRLRQRRRHPQDLGHRHRCRTGRARPARGGNAVAFHPSAPMVACGDTGGGVHLAHLVGIDLGPLVVTAAAHDHELTVRCPACQHRFQIEKERLGSEITCPQEGCNTRLRVNSFVIQQPTPKKNWLSRLLKK